MVERACATRRPLATASRIRANSSRLAWTTSSTELSAATVPLSICMTSVSSSWLRSPMAVMPAMRAPPLSVCSGRFSAERYSALAGSVRQSERACSEASMSSIASSVKIAATSGSKSPPSSSDSSPTLSATLGVGAECAGAGVTFDGAAVVSRSSTTFACERAASRCSSMASAWLIRCCNSQCVTK